MQRDRQCAREAGCRNGSSYVGQTGNGKTSGVGRWCQWSAEVQKGRRADGMRLGLVKGAR